MLGLNAPMPRISASEREQKQRLEGHHEMADRHQHAADDDGATLAEQAVGDQPAQDRREIGKPGVEPEQLRGERLRVELSEQEFERRLDCGEAEHGLDPAGIEQVFHHVEHDQRGIAEIGEALPGLGREQHGEPARMAKEVAGHGSSA